MGRFQEGEGGVGLSPQIAHLRPQHRSMARAVALGAQTPTQLGETYGFSLGQISRIMGSPVFQAEVARLELDMDIVATDYAKDLQLMGEQSLQNLDEDLRIPIAQDPVARKLRNQTSLEVLGMLGISKSTNSPAIVNNILNIGGTVKHAEVKEMSETELRQDVLELIEGAEGSYA